MKPRPDGTIPPHHPNCFGCGPQNAAGLGLRMRVDGDRVLSRLVLDRRHEGPPGLAHGGVIASALDDVFAGVLVMLERPAVTANLYVDYRAPVMLGRTLDIAAWRAAENGRKLELEGEIRDGDRLVAQARALFVTVDIEHFRQSGAPVPEHWHTWLA